MEEENQFTNTLELYQEKVKREIKSLKDVCVDFANTCQQKEKEITAVFSKLKETEVRFSENVDVLQRGLETLKAEKEKEEEKKKKFYQDRVKGEVASLRDLFVDFEKFCQEKENMITDSFEKLHKGTTRQKDEEEMYHTLQEDVRQYESRCAFECGRVSVLEEKVTVIIDENTVGFEVSPESISEMKQELTKLNKLTENHTRTYTNYSKMLKDHESNRRISLTDMRSKLSEQEKNLQYFETKIKDKSKALNEMAAKDIRNQSEIANLIYKLQQQQDDINKLQNGKQKLYNTNVSWQSAYQKKEAEANHYYSQWQRYIREFDHSAQQLRDSREARHQLEKEKKDLVLRLSQIYDTDLTYSNQNIAELGDPNRPTKLAEVFSEIYDNEWTDAYETVMADDEKNKIQFMLKILKDVDTICENVAKRHADAITDGLAQIVVRFNEIGDGALGNSKVIQDNGRNGPEHNEKEAEVDSEICEGKDEGVDQDTTTANTVQEDADYMEKREYEEKGEVIQFKFDELPTTQKQYIEDIRRMVRNELADQVIKAICNAVLKELGPNQTDEIRTYISKCSLFCWTARSHNPPVYVDFMEVTENMRFDMNVYKPYIKTGPLVDYIVWPPIYLHKGGPMLSKGVAQGKKKI